VVGADAWVGVEADPAATGSNGVGIGVDGDAGRVAGGAEDGACATDVEARGVVACALVARGAFASRNSCPT
jgi:hypothetical protein